MNKKMIISQNNKLIKHIKALQIKKNRRLHKQFIIEGIRGVEECLLHDVPIVYLLYTEDLEEVPRGLDILQDLVKKYESYKVSKEVFMKLSDTESPQGILAVVNIPHTPLDTISIDENALIVVLDRIQDPGNMGTIIRTAEAVGANTIIINKGCVDPYNSKTVRATMGALLHIPIVEVNNNEEWVSLLKESNVTIIGSSLDTDKSYLDMDYKGKVAIVIGNEANGIDEKLLPILDVSVKIPIVGKIESLNASIAAALLMYKASEHKFPTKV